MTDRPDPGPAVSEDEIAELFLTGREITAIARSHPQRPAVIFGADSLSFADLDTQAEALAATIAARGLGPGDVVAVLCTNRPEWLVTAQAAMRAGVTLLPVNWHLLADDIDYVLRDSGTRALIVEDRFAANVANSMRTSLSLCVCVGDPTDGYTSWATMLADAPTRSPLQTRGTVMVYTSGTTGRPKGVRQPSQPSSAAQAVGTAMIAMFGMDGDRGDTILCPAPLYHSGPIRLCGEWPLGAGVGVVLMDRFDARRALELIDAHAITHAFFVPTMFSRMLAVPDREAFDVSSLRFVLHGAGPCTIATKMAMFEWFGPIIHEMYAASEGPGTWITPEEWLAHPGSVGRADPERLSIRRPDGTDADPDEDGIVWFRNPNRFEYHGDPEKTAATFDRSGEWYTVGDHGRIDGDGYLHLIGRTAECIVSGGVNIYPARIDEALASAPGVADGAAFGLPDEEMGQVVAAAVVPSQQWATEDIAEVVIDHCRATIGSQLSPRHVFVVDELPRSDAGKLYRHRLVERFSSVDVDPTG